MPHKSDKKKFMELYISHNFINVVSTINISIHHISRENEFAERLLNMCEWSLMKNVHTVVDKHRAKDSFFF